MSKLLRKYLKQVSAILNLDRFQRKCLFTEVQAELEERLEDKNISCLADLVNALGKPEDFAGQLSEMELFACESVAVKRSKKRLIYSVIITSAIIVILAVICIRLFLLQPGYYVVTIE